MNKGPRLKVLAWPKRSPANRYPETLYAHLPEADAEEFSPGWRGLRAITTRQYDIFHIHWLERAFWRRGNGAIVKAVLATLCAAVIVKLKGTRIVWTAHDPIPHDMSGNAVFSQGVFRLIWRLYARLLVAMVDGVILLSVTHRDILAARYPRLLRKPSAIIPHPHFKGVYPEGTGRGESRTRWGIAQDGFAILLPGSIRPYKNAEALITAFHEIGAPGLHLLIAGKADTAAYADELTALADGDPRIRFHFDFIPDEELQSYLSLADLVVIPFRRVTNSGSVVLALSCARPVAIPDIPVFRELRELVGEDWLYLYPGELDSAALERIISWCRTTPRDPQPPLDALSWERIGASTTDFFRAMRTDAGK